MKIDLEIVGEEVKIWVDDISDDLLRFHLRNLFNEHIDLGAVCISIIADFYVFVENWSLPGDELSDAENDLTKQLYSLHKKTQEKIRTGELHLW